MSLRTEAEADLSFLVEDSVFGWAFPITVTDPAGTDLSLTGLSNDIAQIIDPDTGQIVSGRLATVVIRISTLTAGGLELPEGIADASQKPWLVAFDDINGNSFLFKVTKSNPDRTLGIVSLILEFYE